MALYAISDLHLSLFGEKPMDVFGEKWFMHHEKIKRNWENKIGNQDCVLIAGDISWSLKMEDGKYDLEWVHNLPGKKILAKGNHDFYWTSIKKLNSLYEDMDFVQNNSFMYKDYAICGSRGWTVPVDGESYKEHDKKVYERESIRLKLSLEDARKKGAKKFIVMMHYPPFNEKLEKSKFMEIIDEYNVEMVIYGHLHGEALKKAFNGEINGVKYINTSCDGIDFNPIILLD